MGRETTVSPERQFSQSERLAETAYRHSGHQNVRREFHKRFRMNK